MANMPAGGYATLRLVLLLVLCSAPLSAQQAATRFAATDTAARSTHAWTPVRVAKWSTLAAATAAFGYGYTENRSADRDYTAIETLCKQSPDACKRVSETGPYQDATLEARYQSVLKRDRRARSALLGGQLGVLASAVLFIIDLPKSATPQDIPYQPRSIRVGIADGELRLVARVIAR